MDNLILNFLKTKGPSRSSKIVTMLKGHLRISEEAARQRVSRIGSPVKKISVLPKTEKFLYLAEHKESKIFFDNLYQALRETNAIYSIALDGMKNRGGIVEATEFNVVSGAPIALKKQVSSDHVAEKLLELELIEKIEYEGGEFYILKDARAVGTKWKEHKSYSLIEKIVLIHLGDWARKINLASYNCIAIRGENEKREVGAFRFDLTAPSYLFPFKTQNLNNNKKKTHGFLAADVFANKIESEGNIEFFIRKVNLLKASHVGNKLLPLLIAPNFETKAFKKARKHGIIVTTPKDLFGENVEKALKELLDLLQTMALKTDSNFENIISFLDSVSKKIEGTAINLIGDLFEMISLYLANTKAKGVEHSVMATDKEGNRAEIDVLKIIDESECVTIECKGKRRGAEIGLSEIEKWLKSLPIFKSYLCEKRGFEGDKISFEFWTTSTFSKDALALLKEEKYKRKRNLIDWKEGKNILELARHRKQKKIVDILNEQYFKHPLSN